MRVVVCDRVEAAEGVVLLRLAMEDQSPLPEWTPGSHVEVHLREGVTRHYSLCSVPGDRRAWRLGVLREPDGRGGSQYVFDHVQVGSTLEISEPRNHFALASATEYVFVAGGIGITPIIAMIGHVNATGAPWRLLYGGRSRASMALVDELAPYGERVTLAPQDEVGLPDLASFLGQPVDGALVYACGPPGLLDALTRSMASWPAGSLNVERFVARTPSADLEDRPFEVECVDSDVILTVPHDRSILRVVDEAGIAVAFSCAEGTCGTCETEIVGGRAEHRDSVLSADEREEHDVMMICVSRAERGCDRLRLRL